jgi:hypothetical protein
LSPECGRLIIIVGFDQAIVKKRAIYFVIIFTALLDNSGQIQQNDIDKYLRLL